MKRLVAILIALYVFPSIAHAQCGAYLGNKRDGATVTLWIWTYDNTGAGSTVSSLATGDIKVYKDGSTTQRASTSGFSILGPDFDTADTGLFGVAGASIDLSDNTTAGFYQRGHEYEITVGPFTVAGVTTVHCDASFSIENDYLGDLVNDTIATVTSQTKFRLTNNGVGAAGQYRDYLACIDDVSSLRTKDCAWISQADGTDIWLERAMSFTVVVGDRMHILPIRRK